MSDSALKYITDKLLSLDPTVWVERYLTLDGKPFRINGNGYKPYAELYRYIAIKALEKDSKSVVIVKSRQTGVSTLCCALTMYFMGSGLFGKNNPPMRLIHTFPQLDLAFAYSKVKLNGMIDSSVVIENHDELPRGAKPKSYMQSMIDSSSPSNNSLQYKQFENGNHIWIESIGLDAQRLRGRTADMLFIDECADVSREGLGNALKVLEKAQYGNQNFVAFGTPKMRGSALYDLWNQSSQQYYYLGCEKCKKYFPLYTPNSDEWENIWLYGHIVRCTHCGFEQNKLDAQERGKWIGTKPIADCKYVGFHINKMYMPEVTKEKMLAEKPGISAINSEKTYQNEVLGEFFHGETAIISADQIREICGDHERKFRAGISPDENIMTFLGLDFGMKSGMEQLIDSDKVKSKGQSYSSAIVLSVSGSEKLSIEYAAILKQNDVAYIQGFIDKIMRTYSINLAVGDLGFAYHLSQLLQTEYGPRFLSSESTHRVNEKVKYDDKRFPKVITFEKDFWIGDIYEQMKKGNIRFPLKSYEQIIWLINHCTSLEIKPTMSRSGDVSPHYIKGSSSADGFFALLNAYIAYKFYISEGFKIKHPSMMKTDERNQPLAILGYCPRLK